jgi:hypothetical protein
MVEDTRSAGRRNAWHDLLDLAVETPLFVPAKSSEKELHRNGLALRSLREKDRPLATFSEAL